MDKTELKEFKKEFNEAHDIKTFGQKLRDVSRKTLRLMMPKRKDRAKKPDVVLLEDKSSSPALENTQPTADVFIEVPDDGKSSEETENNENSQKTEWKGKERREVAVFLHELRIFVTEQTKKATL